MGGLIKWLVGHVVSTLVVLLLIAIGAIIYLAYHASKAPSTDELIVVPDPTVPIVTDVPEQLEKFRANWDIRDPYQTWPALLPLAELSLTVYESIDKATESLAKYGFTKVAPFDSPFHTQVCYIASGEDVMAIVFRGTNDTEDWIQNFNKYHRETEDGAVHAGFANCYATLRHEIAAYIQNHEPKHIWITGHSLGGAMAVLCAYDLEKYHAKKINGVITFGQPMVGRDKFSAYVQNELGLRYARFVNGSDAVPRMAPGFGHAGMLVWFDGEKTKISKNYQRFLASSTGHPQATNDGVEYIDEIPPLTENEFRNLRNALESKESSIFPEDRIQPEPVDRTFESLEGLRYDFNRLRIPRNEQNRLRDRLSRGGNMQLDDVPIDLNSYESGLKVTSINFRLPWEADHDMVRYQQTIEAKIKQASLEDQR